MKGKYMYIVAIYVELHRCKKNLYFVSTITITTNDFVSKKQ